MTRALIILAALASGCGPLDHVPTIGLPDHVIVSGTHDEFNDSWKETIAVSVPLDWGSCRSPPLDVWNTAR